ncbi:MAG TPA: FAD-dependent oxidoreductase [bacterium]|nr:FAD-dependent oxidoreductase [bacterium]
MVLIVGAGITGLTIAYLLAKAGIKVLVLEKEKQIGGLAKSFRYGNFTFDIGPHRFYTHNQRVLAFIQEILGEEGKILERQTAVYFRSRYYSWPLHPQALFKLPLPLTLRAARDIFTQGFRSKSRERSFKDYIIRQYGPTLYEVFFRDYTQKFLGISSEETHSTWAQMGIIKAVIDEKAAPRSLIGLIRMALFPPAASLKFIYPKGMMGSFCEILAEKIEKLGGKILVSYPLEKMKISEGEIKTISVQEESWPVERVIWTAPLTSLCSLLRVSSRGLEYRAILLYLLEINHPPLLPYQWCYYGDPKIIFSRVSQPNLFNKLAAPPGRSGLCLEILCQKGDDYWENYQGLKNRVLSDLIRVGLIEGKEEIINLHYQRIPEAYPIYHIDYPQRLARIKKDLSRIRNLVIAGRSGSFWYNNMDECIEMASEIASQIIRSKP